MLLPDLWYSRAAVVQGGISLIPGNAYFNDADMVISLKSLLF